MATRTATGMKNARREKQLSEIREQEKTSATLAGKKMHIVCLKCGDMMATERVMADSESKAVEKAKSSWWLNGMRVSKDEMAVTQVDVEQ